LGIDRADNTGMPANHDSVAHLERVLPAYAAGRLHTASCRRAAIASSSSPPSSKTSAVTPSRCDTYGVEHRQGPDSKKRHRSSMPDEKP
jgi:hypothetical protein